MKCRHDLETNIPLAARSERLQTAYPVANNPTSFLLNPGASRAATDRKARAMYNASTRRLVGVSES